MLLLKQYSFYLTLSHIKKLQNYYGIAIRENAHTSVNVMRKAIGAVLFHCSEATDPESRRQFCPKSKTSWCEYNAAQAADTDFVDKPGLPIPLRKKLEPIFRDLSKPELLERCLLVAAQNNESINGVIWTRCPKDNLVGRPVLEMAVCSAILSFNYGKRGVYDVITNCGLETGPYMQQYCYTEDKWRIFKANVKSTMVAKNRRKRLRGIKKGYLDKEASEEVTYASGSF